MAMGMWLHGTERCLSSVLMMVEMGLSSRRFPDGIRCSLFFLVSVKMSRCLFLLVLASPLIRALNPQNEGCLTLCLASKQKDGCSLKFRAVGLVAWVEQAHIAIMDVSG